jgi:uncharacterized membrane protein
MQFSLVAAIADAIHQIGAMILLGGPFFLLLVLRPATRNLESTQERLRGYFSFYRRLFPWLWLSLILLWVSGIVQLKVLGPDDLPMHVQLMTAAGAALFLITLVAHFGFYHQMEDAMDAEHWPRAARRAARVRKAMAVYFLIGYCAVVAGVAAHLVPAA